MKINNETKTGFLVVLSGCCLLWLLFQVGNYSLFSEKYQVRSRFHFTGGVKKHAPVRLLGVDVGEVKEVNVLYGDETLVELVLSLNKGVKLRSDSIVYVTTLGLMGEKYIEIKAGSQSSAYAKEGDLIPSEDPIRLEELIKLGTQVADQIGKTAKDIESTSRHIDQAIVDNKPKLDSIFNNFEDTSVNFRDFSQDIKYHPWKLLIKGREKTRDEMIKNDTLKAESSRPKTNFSPVKA